MYLNIIKVLRRKFERYMVILKDFKLQLSAEKISPQKKLQKTAITMVLFKQNVDFFFRESLYFNSQRQDIYTLLTLQWRNGSF